MLACVFIVYCCFDGCFTLRKRRGLGSLGTRCVCPFALGQNFHDFSSLVNDY